MIEAGTVEVAFKVVADSNRNSMAQTRIIQFAERIFGSKPHVEVATASLSKVIPIISEIIKQQPSK